MYRNLLLSSRVVRAEGGRGEVAEGRGPQRLIDKTQVDHLVAWQSFKCGLLDVSRPALPRGARVRRELPVPQQPRHQRKRHVNLPFINT